jgi:prepilin-type N-terminal cleavage/methylation domain-containing protein
MIILRILPVVAVAEPFCLFPEMDINRFEVMCMRKQFRIKLKSKRGFTLAETLLAVLILLMVSAIVASGIPAAKNAYEKVVLASNAEVLLSTTITTLRNELGTAQDVGTPAPKEGETATTGTVITYYNPTRGASSKLYVASGGDNDKKIMFQRYFSADGLIADYPASPLISSKTSTQDMYVTYTSVSYTNGILTFSGLSVKHGTDTLASRDELSIRVISYQDE